LNSVKNWDGFFSLKEKTMTHGKATNKAAPSTHPSAVAKSSTLILQHDWLKIPGLSSSPENLRKKWWMASRVVTS
jgi:hypothetical protein